MGASSGIDLTVVVSVVGAERTLEASLGALAASCAGLGAEILMVGERPPDGSSGRCANVRWLPGAPGALVPELWAMGIRQAQGRIVALTTGHMIVVPGWARALMAPLTRSVAGVGGPLDLMPGTAVVDWAVFYLRYSAFLPSRWADGPVAGDIAGDNAAYLLEDLRRHAATMKEGFWEVDFHRQLKGEGKTLHAASAARAQFGPSFRLGTFIRQRFEHGRQFGYTRVRQGGRGRVATLVGAPIVPLVLAWRAARRIGADAAHASRFAASLPVFLLFAAAWAAGEATGSLSGHSRPISAPQTAK